MKKKVAVIGATGIAGQQFLAALPNHPDFEVTVLAASSRSSGKSYIDALREPSGAIGWWDDEELPIEYSKMQVVNADEFDAREVDIVFTAVVLFVPHKLFFLRLSYVVLYFLAGTIKFDEGWILGTYFTCSH